MKLLDRLVGAIAPYECLNCLAEGDLLCQMCLYNLPPSPSFGHRLENLDVIRSFTPYSGVAKKLISQLKSQGAQDAARIMATGMRRFINSNDYLLVPAPTATTHARRRGYDQAKLLAKHLSRSTGLPYADCLRRLGQTHQTGASRSQRLKQLNNAFYVKNPRLIRGADILLIDDVVTTGATLEATAQALINAGAERTSALTFAQTP